MPKPNNKVEDILNGVDPETPAKDVTPPPSLEEVIAARKARELPTAEGLEPGRDKPATEAPPETRPPRPEPPSPPPVRPPQAPGPAPGAEGPSPEPEDILKEVEVPEAKVKRPAAGTGPEPPKPPAGPKPPEPKAAPEPTVKQPPLLKNPRLYIIGAAVVGLLLLGGAGWLVYRQIFKVGPAPAPAAPAAEPATGEPAAQVTPPEPEVDSDLDGLPDSEEELYGTNIQAVDTDADGLTDRDEVKIFKTDPNNPDTDGDGYQDGEEVRQGYDPKGTGKLFRTTP